MANRTSLVCRFEKVTSLSVYVSLGMCFEPCWFFSRPYVLR